ncbi:MAG: PEP/pyruvate-binding domain-containing protein [Deltaproteobacteria bacterium]|nr:PEP/pyruvate-binding domain-containing protein [Deltaproteobacteria bacterium]
MAKKWIYWFSELGSDFNDLVGKKCANLGELTKIGMRVPPGFAISVDGYERFMEETGAGEEIQRYFHENRDAMSQVGKQIEASREIRRIIESKSLPMEMSIELRQNYQTLCNEIGIPDLAVAVRSSGAVSMPGQMETYLNIKGNSEVERKVTQVWASAFTARAIAFRIEKNMDIAKAPIGVAIIKMVNAKCAGVVLTVQPTTGDLNKVVVEGNWGLGESVVSGEITPDQFVVDKLSGTCETTISPKNKMVCYSKVGTKIAEVPGHLQCESCLNPSELSEIVRVAKDVENYFNLPQDMEWVIDQDLDFPENIYWVQARPAKYSKVEQDESAYLADLMSRIFRM